MADTITSQNIYLSSWITLYMQFSKGWACWHGGRFSQDMYFNQCTTRRRHKFSNLPKCAWGRDSSVGTANRYGLDGPGIESRWGARFSTPVQTGPGAHPASCTMGTGSFAGVKRPGRGVDHPSPPSAEVNPLKTKRRSLYLKTQSVPRCKHFSARL